MWTMPITLEEVRLLVNDWLDVLCDSVWPMVYAAFFDTLEVSNHLALVLLCLNGILILLFVLKSLFFKPNFVDNRRRTIAIDHLQVGREVMESNDGETTEVINPVQSMIDSQIKQLYRADSFDSVELAFSAPHHRQVTLKDKMGSGFVGTVFHVDMEYTEEYSRTHSRRDHPVCVKLIDVRHLRAIVSEINDIPSNLVDSLAYMFRSTVEVRQALLYGKFSFHYRAFLEAARLIDDSILASNAPRHPNLLYYEQILLYDGQCSSVLLRQKRAMKDLNQMTTSSADRLVDVAMLVMPVARMNLRQAILNNDKWESCKVSGTALWGRQITDALSYLHELRIAHLSIKPENILLFDFEVGQPDESEPLHLQFRVKLADVGCTLLMPTYGRVLSAGLENTLYTISPVRSDDKFSDVFEYRVRYDLHCLAQTLLLALVGYPTYHRAFALPHFPNTLSCYPRYRLVEAIEQFEPKEVIPSQFVDLFRMIIVPVGGPQPEPADVVTAVTVLKHSAFDLAQQ